MSGPDGVGVTLSNADLAFMKLGASDIAGGVSTLDTATPQIRVLAGGQVDGPKLGVAAQGGDSYFLQRFALRTHGRFEPAEAMRFALEHQNPLSTGWVRGAGPYPPASYSLLSVGDAAVLLWALKPAEEGIGRGVIARLWNLGEQAVETPLRFARPLAGAAQASHIETDRVRLPVSGSAVRAPFAPRQMATVRLEPRGTASTSPVR
jgi:alpha-mannosidase